MQVSCQTPLCDEWINSPRSLSEPTFVPSIEPDTRKYIAPIAARRMSKILKRSVVTALATLQEARIDNPDAIIMATGMGCIETSEKFLVDMMEYGESALKPSLFMQSTHNTIASTIAINLKCHAYNNTYSQGFASFASALIDGMMKLNASEASTILVGAHDEATPMIAEILRSGKEDALPVSEAAVSMLLTNKEDFPNSATAILDDVVILYSPTCQDVATQLDIDADTLLFLGSDYKPDLREYNDLLSIIDENIPIMNYRELFGSSYSSPALGVYAASKLLASCEFPINLVKYLFRESEKVTAPNKIVVVDRCSDKLWSIVKVKRICGNC